MDENEKHEKFNNRVLEVVNVMMMVIFVFALLYFGFNGYFGKTYVIITNDDAYGMVYAKMPNAFFDKFIDNQDVMGMVDMCEIEMCNTCDRINAQGRDVWEGKVEVPMIK